MIDQDEMYENISKIVQMPFGKESPHSHFAYGTELLERPVLQALIDAFREKLPVRKRAAAASLFTKYYSRTLLGGVFYAMSVANRSLDGSIGNLELLLPEQAGVAIRLLEAGSSPAPNDPVEREAWREQLCKRVLAGSLQPLFAEIAEAARLSKATLWENAVVYVLYFYQEWQKAAATEDDKARIGDDYRYVTKLSGSPVFGVAGSNPFDIPGRRIDHPVTAGETLRVRQTCCLRLNMSDGSSCVTCPRIDDAVRPALFAPQH